MEPFIGQIIMFGGNFAPRGWAFCDGQLLAISSHSALFSILGTTYGGDGRTTFGLPDLRGRIAMHPGNGPGLTPYTLGQAGGQEQVTLTPPQMPAHNHNVQVTLHASSADGDDPNPIGRFPGKSTEDTYSDTSDGNMAAPVVTEQNTGGGQPHTNVQPFRCVNYIIALVGVFPSRS